MREALKALGEDEEPEEKAVPEIVQKQESNSQPIKNGDSTMKTSVADEPEINTDMDEID